MKKIIIVGLVIVLCGGIFFYWKFTRSPRYSLWQAVKAVKQHDLASFEKYVDVEGMTSNLIDQMLKLGSDKGKVKDEWGQLGEVFAKGLVAFLKPQLVKIAKQQISDYIEKGKFEEKKEGTKTEGIKFSLSDIWSKTRSEKKNFHGIKYVKREGKIVYIGLKLFQEEYNTTLILDLKMRNRGNYWQVAELSNLSEFINEINKLEAEHEKKNQKKKFHVK